MSASPALPVHTSTAEGYTLNSLGSYERGRPEWEGAHFAALLDRIGGGSWGLDGAGRFPALSVVELGSGTGKSTRPLHAQLLSRCREGSTPNLVCVEPTDFATNLEALPGVTVLRAVAEDMPGLASGSAQLVIAAQAFHWFANHTSLSEIDRILAPGGTFVACWNMRDTSLPWTAALEAIIDSAYDASTPRQQTRQWMGPVRAVFGDIALMTLPREGGGHRTTAAGVVDWVLSISVIAKLPPTEREAIAQRVREVLARPDALVEGEGEARTYLVPMQTEFFWSVKK